MTTSALAPFRRRRTWLWLVLPLVVVISMGNRSPRPWGLNWMTALGGARVVVLGIDATGSNADLIVAARFRPGGVHLTHIPRDTYVRTATHGGQKINGLYKHGGPEAIQRQVASFLDTTFPFFLVVQVDAAPAIIDAIGGLEVDVPQRMVYFDSVQNLAIDIEAGRQHLDGEDLTGFLRWRGDGRGDLGRLERRQRVVRALQQKARQPNTWTQVPRITRIIREKVETNLPSTSVVPILLGLASHNVTSDTLPGREGFHDGLSYWFAERGQLPGGRQD